MMADFDAVIFRSGRLMAVIPPEWRPFRTALIPLFLLPVPGSVGFVSSYLPGNAALRALVGLVVNPDWTSPLLAAVAILALFRVARQLWPERPDAVVVCMLMLATSSQVLVTATTSYAMTAHLAVNLVWLWCFLRDDRTGHAGAVATGFIGCGLHQIIFHPLFVAPFIVHLWARRRHRLAGLYVLAYAAICGFWISYPSLVLMSASIPPDNAMLAGAPRFWAVIAALMEWFSLGGSIAIVIDNIVRFIAWQHILLVPLVFASLLCIRRSAGLTRAILAGPLLTLLAVFVLLPWQGHGWGYRYLHGLIGNFCLLAGYGWMVVTSEASSEQRTAAASVLGISTIFTVVVLLPAHIVQARSLDAPYRAAMAAIRQASTEIVIVDPSGMEFPTNLVRNDPFLRGRPKILDLALLDSAAIEDLCARFSVSIFDRQTGVALGIEAIPSNIASGESELTKRRNLMHRLGCGTAVAGIAPARLPFGTINHRTANSDLPP